MSELKPIEISAGKDRKNKLLNGLHRLDGQALREVLIVEETLAFAQETEKICLAKPKLNRYYGLANSN